MGRMKPLGGRGMIEDVVGGGTALAGRRGNDDVTVSVCAILACETHASVAVVDADPIQTYISLIIC